MNVKFAYRLRATKVMLGISTCTYSSHDIFSMCLQTQIASLNLYHMYCNLYHVHWEAKDCDKPPSELLILSYTPHAVLLAHGQE